MNTTLYIIKHIVIILAALSSILPGDVQQTEPYEAQYQSLGIPLEADYEQGIPGRTAWDVEIYDNKLFVAGGDYDKNIGPVPMYYYELSQHQWVKSGSVSDEQIEQFTVIGGKLMAPGSDPRQDWDWGNIYIWENDQWITKRTIEGGIHQLDMIEFDGQIFVALGVLPGKFPVAASSDGCETFREIPMYKDGILFSTALPEDKTVTTAVVRCYDFIMCGDKLYVLYYQNFNNEYQMMLFRYEDGGFHYHNDLPGRLSYRRSNYEVLRAQVQYEARAYFSTGRLYVSHNMESAEEIILEGDAAVSDLRIIDGKLYAISYIKNDDGQYTTSLWVKNLFSETDFIKLFYFTYPSPAQSFTYQDDCFYFGMGEGILSESNPTNGSVLLIQHCLS